MNPYEEIIEGETLMRVAPDARHEAICARLHQHVARCLVDLPSSRLLDPRSIVQLTPGTLLRPDLALVTTATKKLWLAVEIVNIRDHRIDTVRKKSIYEDTKLPRLWMIDPRYDNLEVYHATAYGVALKHILAQRETLTEKLLPGLNLTLAELFGLNPA